MKTKTDSNDFGKRLADLRKKAGFTQIELGEIVSVSNRVISYYERETEYPPSHILVKLAFALHVSTDELLGINPTKEDGRTFDAKFLGKWRDLTDKEKKNIYNIVDSMAASH